MCERPASGSDCQQRLVSDTSRANLALWYALSLLISPRPRKHDEASDTTVIPPIQLQGGLGQRKKKHCEEQHNLTYPPGKEPAESNWGGKRTKLVELQSVLFSRSMGVFFFFFRARAPPALIVLKLLSAVLIDCRRHRCFGHVVSCRLANGAVLQTAALSAVIAA